MHLYPDPGAAPSHRRFQLDDDLLPPTRVYSEHAAYLNHGRCIARNAAGCWIAAVVADRGMRSGNFLVLHLSDTPNTSQGSAFPAPITLFGPHERGDKPRFAGAPAHAALAITDDDQLHVVVELDDGLHLLTVDAAGLDAHDRLARPANWPPPQLIMPRASLGDALVDPQGHLRVYGVRDGDLFEWIEGSADLLPVATDAVHPSVFFEPDGTAHLAFERDRRIYYTRNDTAQWSPPQLAAHWCSSWPSLLVVDGTVLIAYQGEGKVDLRRYPDLAHALRPSGGSTVSFAFHDGSRWQNEDFLRSSQILLKRKTSAGMANHDEEFLPCMEEFWRPSLCLDRHGVAWMYYLNPARRHVYFTRWQGEHFGVHHEARGPYDMLSRIMLCQKDARRSDRIACLTFAGRRFHFDAIEVPSIDAASDRRVVFLDNLEVSRAINLEHRCGQWEKHPDPVFGTGAPGHTTAAPENRIMWAHVEATSAGFEMHYMGFGDAATHANTLPGRAVSSDGYRWQPQPPQDDADLMLDGAPVGTGFWRPVGLRDDDEPDPQRRYKGLHVDWRYEEAGLVQTRTYKVVTSPDGRTWRTEHDLPRVVIGDIVTALQLLRDDDDPDPARRYKIALCAGACSGRGMVVFTSPDLLHWSRVLYLRTQPDDLASPLSTFATGPLVIDPDAAESPWEEENHDAVLWREHGHLMFHYDAFYFGKNQHVDKALAISRDGRHYWRILRGAINMPHGPCGAWDSGRVRTSRPLLVGDELWMWFCGGPASDFSDPEEEPASMLARLRRHAGAPAELQNQHELRPWAVGLAKLRREGWAYMQLIREAQTGELTTLPFDPSGRQLIVNASGLGAGSLQAEVLGDNGSVLPGYTAADCRPAAADGVSVPITWRGETTALPRQRCRLRFVFQGLRARLYAFGFSGAPAS